MKKQHNWYYIFLFLIFVAAIIVISLFNYNKTLQIAVLILISLFYVILGIMHHLIHHTITTKIVIEYIAIAVLGISILLFVLQGM
ncbi:MAG TPA: hypothetical protein VLG12_02600 [Candidatus Saccharimonadales bacterium]|nr:hypothetical protein [Candidatus Saccharimonadales bacterium]